LGVWAWLAVAIVVGGKGPVRTDSPDRHTKHFS